MKVSEFPTTHQGTRDLLIAMGQWIPEQHPDFDALNADGLIDVTKIALCTMQTNAKSKYKMPDGTVLEIPAFCRICPKCFEKEAEEHLSRFNASYNKATREKPNGQWRMKLVQKNTAEATSLKKRIKRNQDGMHMAIDSIDHSGMEEIWAFVEDEPNIDNNAAYGHPNNPIAEINWDAVNRQNKQTGSKVSKGSGLRLSQKMDGEENTKRLVFPGIQPRNETEGHRIREIMEDTNLLEHAENAKEVQHLILLQFQKIIIELEKDGFTELVVKNLFYNISEDKIVKDWNGNVDRCLSLYKAIDEKEVVLNMDILDMVKRFYLTSSPEKEEKLAA